MRLYHDNSELLGLDYKDVYIVPQYSEVHTRKLVDTSSQLFSDLILEVPVMSSNMDTITDGIISQQMATAGGLGVIHRIMSIEDNVKEFLLAVSSPARGVRYPCIVSVGVNDESKERLTELYKNGARYFAIDIAHGNSIMMKNMLSWVQTKYDNVMIIAGNVATYEGTIDLIKWGANAIRVGLAGGSVCRTKNVTGVIVPMLSSISECVRARDSISHVKHVPIIADGGATEIGDVCKAIGCGADFVMTGKLFAHCKYTPGPRDPETGKKIYRGSASAPVMQLIRSSDKELPTPEGMSTLIDESEETVGDVVRAIKGGLQSSMSYCNAKTIKEFQANCRFGIRFNK